MNQAEMIAKWDEHIRYEFSTRDVSSTIATMREDAYVNHVPVMTGGYGHAAPMLFSFQFLGFPENLHFPLFWRALTR
jgi:carboxymethylenebutenolidase